MRGKLGCKTDAMVNIVVYQWDVIPALMVSRANNAFTADFAHALKAFLTVLGFDALKANMDEWV
jgi:hypothetical protein